MNFQISYEADFRASFPVEETAAAAEATAGNLPRHKIKS